MKILLFLTLFVCFSLQAQTEKLGLFKTIGGVKSTVKAMKLASEEVGDATIEELIGVKTLTHRVGDKEFNYRVAYKAVDSKKPTIVMHLGLGGAIDSTFAKYFAKKTQEEFPEHNILIIDTLSSKPMNVENEFFTIGGLEDIPLINHAVDDFYASEAMKGSGDPKLIMVGGSGSSYAVTHSIAYMNREKPVVKGAFLLSGYDSLLPQVEYLIADRDGDKKYKKSLPTTMRIMGFVIRKMMQKRYEEYFANECSTSDTFDFYSALERDFESIKEPLEALYREAYPESGEVSFSSYSDYHKRIALHDHLNDVAVPFKILHAIDDPSSNYEIFKRSLLDGIDNENV